MAREGKCNLALWKISTLVAGVIHVSGPTPLVAPSVHPAACWRDRSSLGRDGDCLSVCRFLPSVLSVVVSAPVEAEGATFTIFFREVCCLVCLPACLVSLRKLN